MLCATCSAAVKALVSVDKPSDHVLPSAIAWHHAWNGVVRSSVSCKMCDFILQIFMVYRFKAPEMYNEYHATLSALPHLSKPEDHGSGSGDTLTIQADDDEDDENEEDPLRFVVFSLASPVINWPGLPGLPEAHSLAVSRFALFWMTGTTIFRRWTYGTKHSLQF